MLLVNLGQSHSRSPAACASPDGGGAGDERRAGGGRGCGRDRARRLGFRVDRAGDQPMNFLAPFAAGHRGRHRHRPPRTPDAGLGQGARGAAQPAAASSRTGPPGPGPSWTPEGRARPPRRLRTRPGGGITAGDIVRVATIAMDEDTASRGPVASVGAGHRAPRKRGTEAFLRVGSGHGRGSLPPGPGGGRRRADGPG